MHSEASLGELAVLMREAISMHSEAISTHSEAIRGGVRLELAGLMREAISMHSEAIRGGVRFELADLDGLGQLRTQGRILH
jgi:hypothetical protein